MQREYVASQILPASYEALSIMPSLGLGALGVVTKRVIQSSHKDRSNDATLSVMSNR